MHADTQQGQSAQSGTRPFDARRLGARLLDVKPDARLGDVKAVAKLCHCSSRHVYRLSDSGKMPRPLKLGALSRWNLAEIEDWISNGCPTVRTVRGKAARA